MVNSALVMGVLLNVPHSSSLMAFDMWFPLPGMLLPRHMHSSFIKRLIRESFPDILYRIYKITSPSLIFLLRFTSSLTWSLPIFFFLIISICLIHQHLLCLFLFTAFLSSQCLVDIKYLLISPEGNCEALTSFILTNISIQCESLKEMKDYDAAS